MTNTPIIAFAKESLDRDFLRGIIRGWGHPIIVFENETICFDNLLSIKPQMIIIKTDARSIVWRFAFALHALKIKCLIVVLTNAFDSSLFNLEGTEVAVHCRLPRNDGGKIDSNFKQLILTSRLADSSTRQDLLVGESPEIRRANASLSGLRVSQEPVLINGEAGTGKELLARRIVNHIHEGSIFVKVDCSHYNSENIGLFKRDAIRDAVVNVLHGESGNALPLRVTIFFDKINNLGPSGQSEVLALLEDGVRPVFDFDPIFRIIATAEDDLDQLVKRNRFRQDLYYRLNVIPVNLPPLRHRREDIPILFDYLAIEACSRLRRSYLLVSPQTSEKLYDYHWPGNVDELKRAVERFVNSGNEAQILAQVGYHKQNQSNSLFRSYNVNTQPDPLEIQSCLSTVGDMSLKSICDKFISRTEKLILQKALEATKWNRKKAAELLNISYKSMLNKMKIYEIV